MSRHDLKSPLAGILSIAKLLRATAGLGPKVASLVEIVERAAYRVMDLVNLSLDLVRMEKGTYRLRPQPVDLAKVVRRFEADLSEHAAAKKVSFRLHCEAGEGAPMAVYASGEELLCYSMLANLLKNAPEASPEGGGVTIDVRRRGEEAEVVIHNRGAVPEQLRASFFEKYRSSGKEGGTGLGTYSALRMAETQGGRIQMRTSEEEGTTLTVILKAAVGSPPDEEESRGAPCPIDRTFLAGTRIEGIAALKVLVVDDDPFNTAVLMACLPVPPVEVRTAVNGRAALETAQAFTPDEVFMDLEMPVLGGLEAVRGLREEEASRGRGRAFVVGLSAHDDAATHDRFLDAGCDRSLVKPAAPEDILAILREVSGRRRVR